MLYDGEINDVHHDGGKCSSDHCSHTAGNLVWYLHSTMITPFLAAIVFTSTFFMCMWLWDAATAAFYYYMHIREVDAYEKIIVRTEALIKREKAYQAEIKELIKSYGVISIAIKPDNKQA